MGRFTAAAAVALAFVLMFTATASASPPTISYSIDGASGANGWYQGSSNGDNVVLHWSVLDATSSDCLAAITIPGPTAGTTQTCSAINADGGTTVVTKVIKIDATPPTNLAASFSRPADYNGWYNHPVTISWSGTDAPSGIANCSSVTYQAPDNAAATVNGGCTDMAGNSATSAVPLSYDSTPPLLHDITEQSTATADVLRWSSTSASDRVLVRRAIRGHTAHTTVFEGSGGGFTDTKISPDVEYVYSLQSFDQADNASKVVSIFALPKVLTLHKTPHLLSAASKPILRWPRVHAAGYYNVQLYRGSKRIYAAWPTTNQVRLPATWKWSGHRYRLTPGRYRWYVWAGFGSRKLARYRDVGSASFLIPRT